MRAFAGTVVCEICRAKVQPSPKAAGPDELPAFPQVSTLRDTLRTPPFRQEVSLVHSLVCVAVRNEHDTSPLWLSVHCSSMAPMAAAEFCAAPDCFGHDFKFSLGSHCSCTEQWQSLQDDAQAPDASPSYFPRSRPACDTELQQLRATVNELGDALKAQKRETQKALQDYGDALSDLRLEIEARVAVEAKEVDYVQRIQDLERDAQQAWNKVLSMRANAVALGQECYALVAQIDTQGLQPDGGPGDAVTGAIDNDAPPLPPPLPGVDDMQP